MAKKLVAITILTAVLVAAIAYAAPGDIVITLTIPAAKADDFRAGFLKEHPIPTITVIDANGLATEQPAYTERQWLKAKIRQYIFGEYWEGKKKLMIEAANKDPNIIQ